ncbi:hypothetical protein [Amycolatopsis mediterranei]|uniref:Uncharacterized protein n=1 Tax=Amycolatopsis mediterranei (strain S699) TaxID=713604 RepID=A0A9R0U957_AMYMS|nr:hypothetical protein [Amycolatopsis mediterranei]AEK42489.1 hypothetical protein RAM_20025 [Amycolatopsis mediterranei S699]KDO05755.1 hypothetical protein DV26_37020 [Amycolatopsis mediterranei]KDU88340.1 hypothetical protein DV36_30960 [Amycolatopsis mediterranei]UZF70909.1 hypothetical protein ISP_004145 [Amycolatopsis mediterranei]
MTGTVGPAAEPGALSEPRHANTRRSSIRAAPPKMPRRTRGRILRLDDGGPRAPPFAEAC